MATIDGSETSATAVSYGRYRRARFLKFSTGPFCRGACRSQNQTSQPIFCSRRRQPDGVVDRDGCISHKATKGLV